MGKKLLGVLIVGKSLLERRASKTIAHAARKRLQVQTLAVYVEHAKQSLQPAAQILGADQKWVGFVLARLD
jgi:hypothetical protein